MSMAVSLECRVPFLDHRLVELAATIPARHKLPNGRLKGLLKDSLKGVLPDSIINRRKRGFGVPVGVWFKQELIPLRNELLSRRTVDDRGLLDSKTVAKLCADHDRGREDYTDLILVMMNLEIWSRLFLDGKSHADVSGELTERTLAAQ
jgi:asparagine synthase (glutamine-hydrolysing)